MSSFQFPQSDPFTGCGEANKMIKDGTLFTVLSMDSKICVETLSDVATPRIPGVSRPTALSSMCSFISIGA